MPRSEKKDRILTGDGEMNLDDVEDYGGELIDPEGEPIACECGATATKKTKANTNYYWAQCGDCAHESYCQGEEAAAQSRYEMDYYSGND